MDENRYYKVSDHRLEKAPPERVYEVGSCGNQDSVPVPRETPLKKKGGRPKGSKNRVSTAKAAEVMAPV